MTDIASAEMEFLRVLHQATMQKAISWSIVDDDEHDLFVAAIDEDKITIELLYLPDPNGAERLLVRLVGLKTWLNYAVGTDGYNLIMEMLSETIFGWRQGRVGALKSLAKATARIRAFCNSSAQPQSVQLDGSASGEVAG